MTGIRLVSGLIVMGVAVPVTIFLLLDLQGFPQFFTIAACTFLGWGAAELLAAILEKPRLQNRSPGHAIGEEFDRRTRE